MKSSFRTILIGGNKATLPPIFKHRFLAIAKYVLDVELNRNILEGIPYICGNDFSDDFQSMKIDKKLIHKTKKKNGNIYVQLC